MHKIGFVRHGRYTCLCSKISSTTIENMFTVTEEGILQGVDTAEQKGANATEHGH